MHNYPQLKFFLIPSLYLTCLNSLVLCPVLCGHRKVDHHPLCNNSFLYFEDYYQVPAPSPVLPTIFSRFLVLFVALCCILQFVLTFFEEQCSKLGSAREKCIPGEALPVLNRRIHSPDLPKALLLIHPV